MNKLQKKVMNRTFKKSVPYEMDPYGNVIVFGKTISGLHRSWRIERNGDIYATVTDGNDWYEEDLIGIAA